MMGSPRISERAKAEFRQGRRHSDDRHHERWQKHFVALQRNGQMRGYEEP
jgi:hypothetical protein